MKLRPLRFAFAVALALACAGVPRAQPPPLLTKAIEVRSLSPAEADSGIPVKLRGVIVYIEGSYSIFVQDETSTTFFRMRDSKEVRALKVGDELEVISKTRMGLYLPGLDYSEFKVLGRRPLPPGIPANYDDLYFGRYHYQRVSVEGIVRSVAPFDTKRTLIRLAVGSRVVEARVETLPPAGQALVDCRVRITGLAAGLINATRRQLVQPYVRVLDWDAVEVLAPAPPVIDVPQISAEELLAFRVTGHGEQRVRIDGVVTASFPPDQIFLRQGATAFAVRLTRPPAVNPGDEVTIVGFPAMERYSASVVDAELIAQKPGDPPAPIGVEPLEELFGRPGDNQSGKHDGTLVSVIVTLRDAFKIEGGTALLVQGRERTLQARLPEGVEVPPLGARVRFTGISQVESALLGTGFASRPGIISLRARSADDLAVLQTPSVWTARRLAGVLGVLAGVTLLAGLWIAILRRQVNRQTDALRRRIESEAALEERQRIAREFHDSLQQDLAGLRLRLDAVATRALDDKGRTLIDASRGLLSRVQAETHNLVSDLRDSAEIAGDLAAVLHSLAESHATAPDVEVRVAIAAPLPSLPASTVHHLRMIARESVANALRHSGAKHIVLEAVVGDDRLVMRIADDGVGFDAALAVRGKPGHFGCVGIRERARKVGSEVVWRSASGSGTTVEVTLPLRPAVEMPSII